MAKEAFSSTYSDWLKRAGAATKGAPLPQYVTADGIAVAPVYVPADVAPLPSRSPPKPWTLVQRVDHPDPVAANRQLLDDLEYGCTGLSLTFRGSPSAHGFGLRDDEAGTLATLLRHVELHAVAIRVDAGADGLAAARNLAAIIASRALNPALLDLCFGIDPIGAIAMGDRQDAGWPAALTEAVVQFAAQDFRGPFVNCDGRLWHNAGATEAHELAYTLATGVAYLRLLEPLNDNRLASSVGMTLAAGQDMFLTLAKFRAMRLLWQQVLGASRLPNQPLHLAGETSWRMLAKRDPHSNILRCVAGVFGASLGGAEQICVLPFSLAQGLPNAFARRNARNLQLVLQEESQLWRTGDPAAGSGYVEHLTQSLCEKAWSLFQDIERQGGILGALQSGTLRAAIAQAQRNPGPIIGSSIHRLAAEVPPEIEAISARIGERAGLGSRRDAETFESSA